MIGRILQMVRMRDFREGSDNGQAGEIRNGARESRRVVIAGRNLGALNLSENTSNSAEPGTIPLLQLRHYRGCPEGKFLCGEAELADEHLGNLGSPEGAGQVGNSVRQSGDLCIVEPDRKDVLRIP